MYKNDLFIEFIKYIPSNNGKIIGFKIDIKKIFCINSATISKTETVTNMNNNTLFKLYLLNLYWIKH